MKNSKTDRIETSLRDKYRLSNRDWNFAKKYWPGIAHSIAACSRKIVAFGYSWSWTCTSLLIFPKSGSLYAIFSLFNIAQPSQQQLSFCLNSCLLEFKKQSSIFCWARTARE